MVPSPPHTPGSFLGQPPPQTGALREDRHPPDGRDLLLLPLRSRVVAVTQADRVRAPAPPCTGPGSEREVQVRIRTLFSTPFSKDLQTSPPEHTADQQSPRLSPAARDARGGCLGRGAHGLRRRTRGRSAPLRTGSAVAFAVVPLQVPVICGQLTTRLLSLTLAY